MPKINNVFSNNETAQSTNGDIVAEHKDSTDKDQTIKITHNDMGSTGNTPSGSGSTGSNTPAAQKVAKEKSQPQFATTGGTNKVSDNWLYKLIYGLFH